ncbi:MAG: hypothetical protein K2P58_02145 [Hyphomonadaceae bacterium]|nr:hypothetical protein [Hyphomonadaceae bacterium]
MSEALVLIAGETPEEPVAWARVDAAGRVIERGVARAGERAPAAHPARTALVISAAEARLRRLELPARTEAQARAGAPFLFEGELADTEDVHYAVGAAQDASGARLAAAMSARRLRQWLDRCETLGADPHVVLLDCTTWPTPAGEVQIVATPQRVIVAGGARGGFTIEPSLAPAVFARWLGEAQGHGMRVVLMDDHVDAWRNALGSHATRLETAHAPDILDTLAHGAANVPAAAPNLRQGAFAPSGRSEKPLKLWRFAALLAAAALLLQVGALLIAGVRDHQAARQTLAAAERDFRELRPGARVTNLRAQVAALVNQAEQSGRHPVLTVSQPLSEVLRQQPLARMDDIRHQSPGRGVVVQLSASDPAALEAVAAALRQQGLSVDTQQLPPRNGRHAAELRLEAPP